MSGDTFYWVEKRGGFGMWIEISATLTTSRLKADRLWARVKEGGFERICKVLDEANV
jgi:hypothetical protein